MSTHAPMKTVDAELGKILADLRFPEEPWEGLTTASLSHYGVMVDSQGTYFPYYRHNGLLGFKVRLHDASHTMRFYAVGDVKDADLFGQRQCSGAENLVITEGEKDAISAYQMLGPGYDVVSIPTGATVKKDGSGVIDKGVKAQEHFLRKYKRIYLCLDQDEAGVAVSTAIARWLGNVCHVVTLPCNDVNDFLKEDGDLFGLIQSAPPWRPTELYTPRDLRDEMLRPVDKGQPYPWPSLNRLLGGMRPGEVIGWGAGVKIGKTNSAMQLTEHIVKGLGEKVGLFYLENQPVSTLQIVSGKMMGDMSAAARNRDWTETEVDQAMNLMEDKVWIYNTRRGRDWETIKPVIRWLAVAEGVKYFFLDPLTALVPGDASKANAFLMDFFKEVSALCMELGIHLNYYSHLNPPKQGLPHEEGGRVQAIQFTGSRAMIRYSSAVVGIERNVIAEDPAVKNKSTVKVLLAREIGTTTGQFDCRYDVDTGAFVEGPMLFSDMNGIMV